MPPRERSTESLRQRKQVLVLHDLGRDRYEIAAAVKLHHTTVARILAANGRAEHPRAKRGRKAVSPRLRKIVFSLHERGVGTRQISQRVGLDERTVYGLLRGFDGQRAAPAKGAAPRVAHVEGDQPQVLGPGERLLAEPIQCSICHATLRVVPCRRCRLMRRMPTADAPGLCAPGACATGACAAGSCAAETGAAPSIELSGDELERYRQLRKSPG
jgi:hypothetical protein